MPPKVKRPTANQHDRRHETGLAAPGKRIYKQRSTGNLNGDASANGKTLAAASGISPVEPLNHHASASATAHLTNGLLFNGNATLSTNISVEERGMLSPNASADSLELYTSISRGGAQEGMVRASPCPADAEGIKSVAAYKTNPLTIAATIIKACPLRDVIATLIILLQLPPTILTVIQFLFATLSLISPNSTSSLPSLSEMLMGATGNPSLPTMILTDLLILVVWLVLWVPAQNLALDFAQAVIAISMGGAVYGKGGITNSIFICAAVILLSHTFRSKPFQQFGLSLFRPGLSYNDFESHSYQSPSDWLSESLFVPSGWIRCLLGVHILAQGLVKLVRWSLSPRESSQRVHSNKKMDPEAGTAAQAPRNSISGGDSGSDVVGNHCSDGRHPEPPPAPRDAKERSAISKKKKRQANHARTQQPLWAAIASLKVTVLSEMEHGETAADAIEANAADINHIGNANFYLEEDRIWISDVSDTSIHFGANLVRLESIQANQKERGNSIAASGIDKSKPFFVRVNGADWGSTRIRHAASGACDVDVDVWTGEIFGLTEISTYQCEFVRRSDKTVIFAASILTNAGPSAEQVSVVTSPSRSPLRPSSPTTTLKNSIAAAEQRLQDQRNRLKRNKKDHKTAVTTLKKDVDSLGGRKSSSSGSEDRLKQRELQLQQHIQQGENVIADITAEIEALGDVPEEEQQQAMAKKARWDSAREANFASQEDLANIKKANDRKLAAVLSDLSSAVQKRDRLQARQTKLAEQYDRLALETAQGADARARRESERATRASQRSHIEQQYIAQIEAFERQTRELTVKMTNTLQATNHLNALYSQVTPLHVTTAHQMAPPGSSGSGPSTPEGPLPGTGARGYRHSIASPFAVSQFPAFFSSPGAAGMAGSMAAEGGRARSSSMLSTVSGFTDDMGLTGGPAQERKHSDGSGSGSDPPSPLGGRGGRGATAGGNKMGYR